MKQLAAILVIGLASLTLNAQTKVYNDPDKKKSATFSIEKTEGTETHRALDPKSAAKGNHAELPADFPQYVNTGNPESDNQVYESAKAYWYQMHPEAVKTNTPSSQVSSDSKKIFTKEEFEKLSGKRKEFILNNPDKFEVLK